MSVICTFRIPEIYCSLRYKSEFPNQFNDFIFVGTQMKKNRLRTDRIWVNNILVFIHECKQSNRRIMKALYKIIVPISLLLEDWQCESTFVTSAARCSKEHPSSEDFWLRVILRGTRVLIFGGVILTAVTLHAWIKTCHHTISFTAKLTVGDPR
jgi:hypothetical protein